MVGSASTPQTISRASTAFWSRCSGPIDEASSGEMVLGRILVGWLSGVRTKVWEDRQSPVSGKWRSLASPAILLVDQVHQLFPLLAATVGLPRKRSLLEMRAQILKAGTTKHVQTSLSEGITQDNIVTCLFTRMQS